jgi:hypothetical protein
MYLSFDLDEMDIILIFFYESTAFVILGGVHILYRLYQGTYQPKNDLHSGVLLLNKYQHPFIEKLQRSLFLAHCN